MCRLPRVVVLIEFGKADLGVCVDDSLLIDPAHALQCTEVKGILRAAIAGAFALDSGRYQALPCRNQRQPQAFHLDHRSRQIIPTA